MFTFCAQYEHFFGLCPIDEKIRSFSEDFSQYFSVFLYGCFGLFDWKNKKNVKKVKNCFDFKRLFYINSPVANMARTLTFHTQEDDLSFY